MCFSLESHVSFGADTISSNQSLSGNLKVVSAGGVFQLGFFRPGNSSNYYIGIWYKRVSQLTTVWVANRKKPIRDMSSSVLKISDDDGNLVLRDGTNSSTILWQSFDHPTDTWLPGSKLRLDKWTNQSQRFTSWSQQYWTSGTWDEQTEFQLSSENENESYFIYSFYNSSTITRLVMGAKRGEDLVHQAGTECDP
ncbi:hypothetical protein CRYUN_Cryun18bG0063500 [Craigia yunnanensis]